MNKINELYNMESIIKKNKDKGQYFFSKDTMRFFQSRLGTTRWTPHGTYFVTSERQGDDYPRLYTLRYAEPDGNIETVGEFQEFKTSRSAYKKAEQLIKERYGTTHPLWKDAVEGKYD